MASPARLGLFAGAGSLLFLVRGFSVRRRPRFASSLAVVPSGLVNRRQSERRRVVRGTRDTFMPTRDIAASDWIRTPAESVREHGTEEGWRGFFVQSCWKRVS